MAQSHPALRAISRLPEKCQRASHSQPQLPLTPALSLRERENPPLTFITTQRGVWPRRTSRTTEPAAGCSLSPWEGQSEGNRLAVSTQATRTLPEMSNFASPPAEPEVSHDNQRKSGLPLVPDGRLTPGGPGISSPQ